MKPSLKLCESLVLGRRWLGDLVLGAALLTPLAALHAQDYKTAFSAVAVDRGKSPATWHGGVSVDPATGALSVEIPLGPGIGGHGLHFTPTLRSRWSPQWSGTFGATPVSTATWNYYNYTKSQLAGAFERMGGGLSWNMGEAADIPADDTMAQPPRVENLNVSSIHYPDGGATSLDSYPVPATSLPTPSQVQSLIGKFGYGSDWQIAHDPGQVDLNTGLPLGDQPRQGIHLGADGSLIVALVNPAIPENRYWSLFAWLPITAPETLADGTVLTKGSQDRSNLIMVCSARDLPPDWPMRDVSVLTEVPPKILVIKGDIAYEFTYFNGQFSSATNIMSYSPDLGFPKAGRASILSWLIGADYLPSRMINRVGDAIAFTESTATWIPKGGTGTASVSFTPSAVTYQGGDQNPSFTLAPTLVADSSTTRTPAPGIFRSRQIINSVTNNGSGEVIKFSYSQFAAPAPTDGTPWTDSGQTETVLCAITFPGRRVGIGWGLYTYWLNENWINLQNQVADSNGNIRSLGGSPHWAHGVTELSQTDLASGMTRAERHLRVVPQPNLANLASSNRWLSRDFYDAVTHPDGSITVHRFVPPPPDGDASASAMRQRLAYLKNMVWETREYPIGADWQTDLANSPSSGTQPLAYKITEHDRWDVRSPANLNGDTPWTAAYSNSPAIPVATRTRVWDVNNQVMTTDETYGWDATNRSHARTGHWVSASQAGLGSIDYLSRDELSVQGITTLDPPAITSKHSTTRGLTSDLASWIWGQVPSENTTITDQSQGIAPGQPQPYVAPPVSRTYDDLNRVKEITRGAAGGTTTTVTFTFQDSGSAGAQGQLGSAVLKGITGTTPLALSGQVGASYGYDDNGFMNLIHPTGGWDLLQAQDSLGYAKSQTDANGLTTTLQWDAAGRLTGVQPPSPELGTTVSIDPDSLGFVVRRGAEASRVRFNAFGELVLVQRSLGIASDGSDKWSSHKAFAYDPGGRKLGETIWLPGPGDETEWQHPNLTMPFTISIVLEAGYWDTEIDEVSGKVHTSWVPPVYGQELLPKLYDGSSWTYDGQGRLIGALDPNKVPMKTVYGIRTRTVTRGSGTGDGGAASTTFTSDPLGRLIGVVDALGRSTAYRYDPMGRVVSVTQYSETAKAQVRTWEYNNLGWLTAITQPESGRTEYADFTALGKPRTTRYGVVNGTPAKTTTTLYDVLGRVIGLTASDFSTSQAFTYDDPTKGLAKGKLTQATADSVSRTMEYNGLNGRLSKLTRSVDGLDFVQTFDYNTYGFLSSRTYPGRATPGSPGIKETIGLDAYRQVPNSASYNGGTLVWMAYDPTSWALSNIAYQGAVAGGNAFFGYDTDQARLKSMVLAATWTDPATG
ncbi:MAG TPA: hypothetical protein VJ486_13935, partial [Geothrix sp.]|nr:hypothetical protein [Geothrix sp.]